MRCTMDCLFTPLFSGQIDHCDDRGNPSVIVVTNMEQMSEQLKIPLNQADNSTDLVDIDDEMSLPEDDTKTNLIGAIKPELPVNPNIRELTNEVLSNMRQTNSFNTEWVAVPHHL